MKHLRQKIIDLLENSQFNSTERQLQMVREFLKTEFEPHKPPIDISVRDLLEIRSRACDAVVQMRTDTTVNSQKIIDNPELLQVYAYAISCFQYLRAKGVVFHDIRMGDQKDENERNKR